MLLQRPYKIMLLLIAAYLQPSLSKEMRIAVIGAGCGAFPSFLGRLFERQKISNRRIDAVDIDFDVLEIGRRFFDFHETSTLKIVCKEGMEFLEAQNDGIYDLIMIDVANGETQNGQTMAPPTSFYSNDAVQIFHRKLKPTGSASLNVIGGIDQLQTIHRSFRTMFRSQAIHIPDATVYFAHKTTPPLLNTVFPLIENEAIDILKWIRAYHDRFANRSIGFLKLCDLEDVR